MCLGDRRSTESAKVRLGLLAVAVSVILLCSGHDVKYRAGILPLVFEKMYKYASSRVES